MLVYSITARATFERIERFRHQIARVKDSDSIPIVLVGNKSDRANEREVGKEEGAALARKLGCEFVETSAKTRSNLEVAYYTVVRLSEWISSGRAGELGRGGPTRRRQANTLHPCSSSTAGRDSRATAEETQEAAQVQHPLGDS